MFALIIFALTMFASWSCGCCSGSLVWALAHSVVLIGTGCCVTGENDHLRMGLGGRIGNGLHLRVLWLLGSAVGVDLVWFPE